MSRKLTQFLAVLLIVSSALLGGWAGFISTRTPPAAAISAPATATKAANEPVIFFPPPLVLPEIDDPTQAASAPQPGTGNTSEIIPGGMLAGQAADRMWETTANLAWQVRAEPLTPLNWFITGVVRRGNQTQIIVQFDGEPQPRFLKIGDVLPGGGKLAWVRPDAIGVITPGRKKLDVSVLSGAAEHNSSPATSASKAKPSEPPRR